MESTTSVNLQAELIRLRKRLLDLQALGLLTPEGFGMYQQTILQLWQGNEQRRQTCINQAESLRRQADAAEAQGHAFSAMSSMLFSVVNGYIELEEKRIREEQERAAEREEKSVAEPVKEASASSVVDERPMGRRKKP